jgi:hypothetical protein
VSMQSLAVLLVLVVIGTWPGARYRRSGASGPMTWLAIFFGQLAAVEAVILYITLGIEGSWQFVGGAAMFLAIPAVAVTALIATPIVLALVPQGDDWA